jgi:hypothetical protein
LVNVENNVTYICNITVKYSIWRPYNLLKLQYVDVINVITYKGPTDLPASRGY